MPGYIAAWLQKRFGLMSLVMSNIVNIFNLCTDVIGPRV